MFDSQGACGTDTTKARGEERFGGAFVFRVSQKPFVMMAGFRRTSTYIYIQSMIGLGLVVEDMSRKKSQCDQGSASFELAAVRAVHEFVLLVLP